MENITRSIENTPIFFNESIRLPDISFCLTYTKIFMSPDDPQLDPAHIHDDYEIYFHLAGSCSFLVNNTVYPLNTGDVILTRPGDVHFLISNAPDLNEHFCLWLSPACGKELLSFCHAEGFEARICFNKEDRECLSSLFFELSAYGESSRDLEKASYLLRIISTVSKKNTPISRGATAIPSEMQKIIDYVDKNFQSIDSVKTIAKDFNISSATLNRWFRRYIKISPQEFLKAKRLAYAKKLLDGGATVTESCMRSGFSDCSYFISVFKQKFGDTPHKYQKHSSL